MKSVATTMGIGELARVGECRVDTIRYYERIGLMPKPARSAGGQRRYNETQARQLLFIRRLRDLGFSIEEAAEFLQARRRQFFGCGDFRKVADARIGQIRQQIAELRRLERRLREISAHCREGEAINCGIVEALWSADRLDLDLAPRGTICCAAPAP
ncbi:MAG: MerR family transcriptional regulator [Thiohalocapsa sp.]